MKLKSFLNLTAPLLALIAVAPIGAIDAAPRIFWLSDPVRPNETAVILGDGLGADAVAEFARLDGAPPVGAWTRVKPLQAGPQAVKAVVPADWKPGLLVCRVRVEDAVSNELEANAPVAWWWNGDGGEFATPGGWVRVFGKSLGGDGASRVRLRCGEGPAIELKPAESDAYALRCALPQGLTPGDYKICLHNGDGGEAGWRDASTLVVRAPEAWKTDVFNVKDFGPRPAEALRAALEKAKANGGGIVYLPRGRYPIKDSLVIPPGTILRGEAMELVSLYWPDFDDPPKELVSGADYGLEGLTLYCQHHRSVVADTPASQRFFADKVRIRANCFFMIEDIGKEFRGRHGPASHRECGAAVLLRGKNFAITDCDIYASNKGLQMRNAKCGVVARSQIRYGGRGYNIENTERLIFEDNVVEGNHLLAIGNDITTFWSNYCRHIYYARNRVRQMYGADREMMTLDAAGGAYFGKVAAVDGVKLTLAGDPVFRDYAPKPHRDWTGAAVQVLDGRGAGQYRFVASHAGREWQVDRPWTVPPDASSRISIAPFRGQSLFIGNTFEDGGAFQLYGAAHDSIVAANKGSRMDGFLVWGLNPHGWGQQPSWGCQFLDNEIVEGNGYGGRSGGFGTVSGEDPKVYDGPLVRGTVFRRNVCHNNASFRVGGNSADTVVEHCVVRDNDVGISISARAEGTLLRDNKFENVGRREMQGR